MLSYSCMCFEVQIFENNEVKRLPFVRDISQSDAYQIKMTQLLKLKKKVIDWILAKLMDWISAELMYLLIQMNPVDNNNKLKTFRYPI